LEFVLEQITHLFEVDEKAVLPEMAAPLLSAMTDWAN
jgi:hypothetical protein